jgi:hypothetical protein
VFCIGERKAGRKETKEGVYEGEMRADRAREVSMSDPVGKLGACFLFFHICGYCICLDEIVKFIARGSYGSVHEALLKNNNRKMALKMFEQLDTPSTDRDVSIGLRKDLLSDYTIIYEDVMEYKGFMYVSMALMTKSLDKIIFNQSERLKDEVFFFFFFFFLFYDGFFFV